MIMITSSIMMMMMMMMIVPPLTISPVGARHARMTFSLQETDASHETLEPSLYRILLPPSRRCDP